MSDYFKITLAQENKYSLINIPFWRCGGKYPDMLSSWFSLPGSQPSKCWCAHWGTWYCAQRCLTEGLESSLFPTCQAVNLGTVLCLERLPFQRHSHLWASSGTDTLFHSSTSSLILSIESLWRKVWMSNLVIPCRLIHQSRVYLISKWVTYT